MLKIYVKSLAFTLLLSCTSLALADQCPDTSKPLPSGWSVYSGQITHFDTFAKAMINTRIMNNVSCYYSNPVGELILYKPGGFKPTSDAWSTCQTGFGKCCMQSQDTCTFLQTSLQVKKL